jgi:pimeloyl-ACP methyl ester carboxylesterase
MGELSNAFGLVIGVGNDLPASAEDARAIYNILIDQELAGYKKENISLLVEGEATNTNIIKALDDLVENTDEESSVFMYYSGHGGTYTDNDIIELEQGGVGLKPEEENRSHYYLVPNNFDAKNFRDTWVLASDLKDKLRSLKSRRLILFLDCCHAEGMTKAGPEIQSKSLKDRIRNPEGLVHKIDDGRGISIVSSCRADELSWILGDEPNSLFTTCLLEVLRGEHKEVYEEPFIRMTEVVQYVMKRVPERKPVQRPFVNLQLYDDFILSSVPNVFKNRIRSSDVVEGGTDKSAAGEVVTSFREEGSPNLVLFVHGFSGEAAGTFGEIPQLLIGNKDMNGWDLMPLGYTQHVKPEMGKTVWASENDILRIADYLRSVIEYKFDSYRRIALIGHSLGGLVVQQALVDLDPKQMKRISHVLCFATPSNGITSEALKKLCDAENSALQHDGNFISSLRKQWNTKFEAGCPFEFKAIAATNDEFVPVASSLEAFEEGSRITLDGNHYSLVNQSNEENDSYQLILQTLTGNTFHSQYTNQEEVNIALGKYDAVIKELLPKKDGLNLKGLRNLIFALEGMDRTEEALGILQDHPLAKENSDLMGILGGRFKRKYLQTLSDADGQKAIEYYTKGLALAEAASNAGQIYYLSINLAFLSLVCDEDQQAMQEYAQQALEATAKDAFDNLWKLATIAEAHLYMGQLEESKVYYKKAAEMAGIREKISIHTNAYAAYTSLMHTENPEDDFIKFLKINFLS